MPGTASAASTAASWSSACAETPCVLRPIGALRRDCARQSSHTTGHAGSRPAAASGLSYRARFTALDTYVPADSFALIVSPCCLLRIATLTYFPLGLPWSSGIFALWAASLVPGALRGLDFEFASTLAARRLPRWTFVFLWSQVCLAVFSSALRSAELILREQDGYFACADSVLS
jgi:hypothetical protein